MDSAGNCERIGSERELQIVNKNGVLDAKRARSDPNAP